MPFNGAALDLYNRTVSEKTLQRFWPPLPAEYVTVFSGWTDTPKVTCDTHTHIHIHVDPTTVTLAVDVCRGLTRHASIAVMGLQQWGHRHTDRLNYSNLPVYARLAFIIHSIAIVWTKVFENFDKTNVSEPTSSFIRVYWCILDWSADTCTNF